MARYRKSVCRQCRREGGKLFLKGERCLSDKCAFDKRAFPPGVHGQRRTKISEYGRQLREKQKAKRIYGILEKQFRNYFRKADKKKGVTGDNLLEFLECRLDNVVYRLGFAMTRNQARQFVLHRHFTVNNKRVNIPSYQIKEGDVVTIHDKSKSMDFINNSLESSSKSGSSVPSWLSMDSNKNIGTVTSLPNRGDIDTAVKEQLIVELYSK